MKKEHVYVEQADRRKKKTKAALYQTVWRWHFYAGIIFAPFIIVLAISGGIYLFKPQIESYLYKDLYVVHDEHRSTALPLTEQKKIVESAYPNGLVTSFKLFDDPNRTIEIGVMDHDKQISAFVDPYTGDLVGSLDRSQSFTEIFKKIHSELWIGGTIANRMVELAACWAIILLITGIYIWWPRNKRSIWGTFFPRLRSKGKVFWRDMHAVPAFWLSIWILIIILSGIPWTGVVGEGINRFATATNTGYPPFALSFLEKPESKLVTKDVAEDVPWASENLPVPESLVQDKYVTLDRIHLLADEEVARPYTISLPQGETGVYTIATSHDKPTDSATIHVDQYSGEIISDVRFNDYGITAKVITIGIALHEGRLFGLWNQLLGLLVCFGLILMILSSFILWRKRKSNGKLSAPKSSNHVNVQRSVFYIMIGFGILMPLVGISIIVVFLLDRFVLRKLKKVRAWLY